MTKLQEQKQFLKIMRSELFPVVADEPGVPRFRVQFLRFSNQQFRVDPFHGLAEPSGEQSAAVPVKDTQEVIKRAGYLDIREINMPLLMHRHRLVKALLGRFRCFHPLFYPDYAGL
jgi:hypothetical protein